MFDYFNESILFYGMDFISDNIVGTSPLRQYLHLEKLQYGQSIINSNSNYYNPLKNPIVVIIIIVVLVC